MGRLTTSDPPSREAEIAARLETIAKGEWRVVVEVMDGRDVFYVGPGSTNEDCAVVGMCSADGHEHHDADNAEFIAHAPADLRYLLAQLQQAREALEKYGQHQNCPRITHDVGELPCTCGLDAALKAVR